MTYIAYKASKAPSLLAKTVGHKPQNHCPQLNPHRPHLLRVYPYEIIVDNCKGMPYIMCVGNKLPTKSNPLTYRKVTQ